MSDKGFPGVDKSINRGGSKKVSRFQKFSVGLKRVGVSAYHAGKETYRVGREVGRVIDKATASSASSSRRFYNRRPVFRKPYSRRPVRSRVAARPRGRRRSSYDSDDLF